MRCWDSDRLVIGKYFRYRRIALNSDRGRRQLVLIEVVSPDQHAERL